jgi:formylglycine-generating enzyme
VALTRQCALSIITILLLNGAFAPLCPEVSPLCSKPPAPKPARLDIDTSPSTEVYLDDQFAGCASSKGRLVSANARGGERALRGSLTSKKDFERKVTKEAGRATTITATPTDLAEALVVQIPTWAAVYLDRSRWRTTGASGHLAVAEVAAGSDQLRVAAPGKIDYRRRLTVPSMHQASVAAPLTEVGPTPGAAKVNSKDGLKYVLIPGGTFMMGCSPGDNACYDFEKPSHQVTITKSFWLGQTEVTVGAYKRFAAATGRPMPAEPNYSGRPINPGWVDDAMPIVDVTWYEAQAYCSWAGGRLPTDAEWEYAARGGSTTSRYGDVDEIAWYADNSGGQHLDSVRILKEDQANYAKRLNENGNGMHEVGLKRANGFGLYDTLGNVWEWVNDWYDPNYFHSSPSRDPSGPPSGQTRVLRGGSWSLNSRDLRVSPRDGNPPSDRAYNLGVRCARDVAIP